MKLSVVLATYNEAANLERCLASVQDIADEVVVADGGSGDETLAIAKRWGAKIIKTTNKPMFHTNKQLAMDAAKGDWVLQLDADEEVDAELLQAIKTVCKQNPAGADGYYVKRKNYFLGKFLTKGGQYPDMVVRFYRNGKGHLPQKSVHEQIQIEGRLAVIGGHLNHYNAPTFSRYLTNSNRYTSLTARELVDQGVRLTWFNDLAYLICKPVGIFVNIYIRHRGYIDGFPGFIFALFSGLHFAVAYMKIGDIYRENSH